MWRGGQRREQGSEAVQKRRRFYKGGEGCGGWADSTSNSSPVLGLGLELERQWLPASPLFPCHAQFQDKGLPLPLLNGGRGGKTHLDID